MRVLMLNNEFPPLGGGTGTVNQALLQRLAKIPYLDIDMVTSAAGADFEHERLTEQIHIYKLPVNRRDIHHASNVELITYSMRAALFSLRMHVSSPYDLCMAWSAVPAGGSALALHRLTGLRFLVRVCGPDIPGFEERYSALYPILTPMIKAIWHGADTVVAKCSGEADLIHTIDPAARVMLIPNGVDLTAFRRASLEGIGGPLKLLCVARLIERKGQHHLIEAVKMLTNMRIDVSLGLIGSGDALPEYQALVESHGISDRVRFLGYVPREQIAGHYASADVFVLPSYNEGMSVATLEAMASGLPVVVSRTGGTKELVVEGVNGLTFDWGDVDKLAGHLSLLAGDRELVRRLGAASRHRAGLFSWESAAERYLRLFEDMAPQHPYPSVERAA